MTDKTLLIETQTSFWLLKDAHDGREQAEKTLKFNLDSLGYKRHEYKVYYTAFPKKGVGVCCAVIVPDATKNKE